MKRIKNIIIFLLLIFIISGCSKLENKDQSIKEESGINNPTVEDFNSQAMVTFSYDDGLLTNYENALPLHEKHDIPATFNILGKRAIPEGEHEDFLTIEMIKDSYNRGIDIASHTYYHENLTEKNEDEIHFEMSESKKVLEAIVGEGNVNSVAIPYSKHNETIRTIAMEYYDAMRVHEYSLNDIPVEDDTNLYSAIAPLNDTTFEDIKEQIDLAIAEKKWAIIMLHGIDPEKDHRYEITPTLLEELFEYVNSFDNDELLAVNTRDALKFMKKIN